METATADVKPVAEPSAAKAPVAPVQYDNWDEHGTPVVSKKPEPPKTEEPAASAATAKESESEPKGKSAAEAETARSQEKEKKERKPGEKLSADERIAQLIAENKSLKEERERSRQPDTKPAPKAEERSEQKAASAPPATYAEWRKAFQPKAWIEQWAKDNPAGSYEDAVAAMGDYQSDMRAGYQNLELQQQKGKERSAEQLKKTVEKYPDAEPKVREAAKAIMQPEVPPFVRAFIDDSDVMTDLLYTLSDQATLAKILDTAKTQPGKALRVLRDMELAIEKAVQKPAAEKSEKSDDDQAEKSAASAEPKPRAPKPPTEVGGRGTGQVDLSLAAARAGDYRAFEAAENAKMKARHAKA